MTIFGIIAILFAIVVPTFQSQAGQAQVVQTTSNLKQLVTAVESCAAQRVDGTYRGSDASVGPDCLDPTVLIELERSLEVLDLGVGPALPGSYQVAPLGDGSAGYMVQGATEDDPTTWFAELHHPTGEVIKVCGGDPFTDRAEADSGQDAPGCEGGSW